MGNNFLLDKTLKQLANDDKNALEKIFNYYYPRLYCFSKTLLKLDEGVEHILQEVFLRIYQNRKNIKSTETFQSYIFTITRNLLLNELRSRLHEHKAKEKIYRESVAREYLLSEKIEFLELQEKLEQIIETLPDRRREIYLLSRKKGLSHKEIAVKLDLSEKTVEYHITQSLSEIKKKMREIGLLAMLYFYFFL